LSYDDSTINIVVAIIIIIIFLTLGIIIITTNPSTPQNSEVLKTALLSYTASGTTIGQRIFGFN